MGASLLALAKSIYYAAVIVVGKGVARSSTLSELKTVTLIIM